MPDITIPGRAGDAAAPAHGVAPVLIVDDFLPLDVATAMRADIEAHFAAPDRHGRDTHQIWNYWYVPGLYTYLRTAPERVIRRELVAAFHTRLRDWSVEHLGLGRVTWPNLSLYVSGCRQGWHNDARNGRFAFVYSLTRNERATFGGETLVMRDGDALRTRLTQASAGRDFLEAVPPLFNRLVLFDDRAAHAVERVDGSMDPVEGRLVMHGHISEDGPVIEGPLPADAVNVAIDAAVQAFSTEAADAAAGYHGPLSLRLNIAGASGEVEVTHVIIDRVIHPDPANNGWEHLRERLCDHLETLRLPTATADTSAIVPIMLGGALKRRDA